jgi:hypothetical protein
VSSVLAVPPDTVQVGCVMCFCILPFIFTRRGGDGTISTAEFLMPMLLRLFNFGCTCTSDNDYTADA